MRSISISQPVPSLTNSFSHSIVKGGFNSLNFLFGRVTSLWHLLSVRCVGRSVGVLVCWNVRQIKTCYKDGKLHFHFSYLSNCFFPLAWHAERCHWNEWYQGQGFANLCVSLANFCASCKFSGDSARGNDSREGQCWQKEGDGVPWSLSEQEVGMCERKI